MNGGSNPAFEILGDRTLSVWVRSGPELSNDQGIVGYLGSSGALAGHAGYLLKRRFVDPNIIGAFEDSALVAGGNYGAAWSNVPMPTLEWHHLVQWRSGGITHLYVDGMLQSSTYTLVPYFLNSEFLVGWSGSAGQYFDGGIDDIGFWNRALTQTEIQQVFQAEGPSSCLIASYPFDGNANDVTGNGHDGTVYGAALAADRFGEPNSCYQFDGINDFIDITGNWSNGGSNGTFSAYIYLDDMDETMPLFTHADVPNVGNAMAVEISCDNACEDTSGLWYAFDDRECGGLLYANTTYVNLLPGVWTHVAVTTDDLGVHLFVNCTEVANYIQNDWNNPGYWFADLCGGTYSTLIGRWSDTYFKGRIDDEDLRLRVDRFSRSIHFVK
ncbi:MAG: laminin G domain-containing protein [Flavobacteriales bacterium]|nr:laminin G domain-containing protein [Flavobacteriales bacterium]